MVILWSHHILPDPHCTLLAEAVIVQHLESGGPGPELVGSGLWILGHPLQRNIRTFIHLPSWTWILPVCLPSQSHDKSEPRLPWKIEFEYVFICLCVYVIYVYLSECAYASPMCAPVHACLSVIRMVGCMYASPDVYMCTHTGIYVCVYICTHTHIYI